LLGELLGGEARLAQIRGDVGEADRLGVGELLDDRADAFPAFGVGQADDCGVGAGKPYSSSMTR
jgi:hypothetical protein